MNVYRILRNKYKKHEKIVENLSYLSILQIFLVIAPLITYPYLVKVIGLELYGVVVSAQMLMSYAAIIIDCGTNSVCAKHISIHRNNPNMLSEIVSSVLVIRSLMAVLCFLIYLFIVFILPSYRSHYLLFIFTYGMLVQEILFPQYFFQGMEKLKYVTIISVMFKSVFIIAIFFIIKSPADYLYVPLLYMLGYGISSVLALYIVVVKMKVKLYLPEYKRIVLYMKDSFPIFATDVICTIKDKFNYFFIGTSIGMSEVTIYDLGIKLNGFLVKPTSILETVMFPRFAKNKNFSEVRKFLIASFALSFIAFLAFNICLPWVVDFFIHKEIDLFPIRLLSLAPVILSIGGGLGRVFMVAFGYNKYVFYSIIVTTFVYLSAIVVVFILHLQNLLMSFVFITIISYITELMYRLYATRKLINSSNYPK